MKNHDIYSELESHVATVLTKDQRPNILLLFTDQQRFDTIGALGYPHMITPNLDNLAADGRVYLNAYSPNPICCPVRHNLITGLPARYHGIADNEFDARCNRALPTLPQLLSDAGYHTRAIGKMHYQPATRHNGFDVREIMEEVPAYIEDDDYLQFLHAKGYGHIQNIHGVRNLLYMNSQNSLLPEELHGTRWVADRTIDFLQHKSRNRPYFLFAGWIAPHPPFNVPHRLNGLYADADLPQPLEARSGLCSMSEENKAWGDFPAPEYERAMREAYHTQITFIDEQIGRIIDTLKFLGEYDNTLIIFSSDHGEMLGDLGCYQKFLPFDGSARIPLIIRYPERTQPGEKVSQFADINDFMPTILDAAGVSYPGPWELPGESLLNGHPEKDRRSQYLEYSRDSRRWVSLLTEDYKYVYYYGGGREELFDRRRPDSDSWNLLEHEPDAFQSLRQELRSRLAALEKRWGLPGYTQNNDFVQLDEYIPNPHRNSAIPLFPYTISEIRTDKVQDFNFYKEVEESVRHQNVVHIEELDLASFFTHKNLPQNHLREFIQTYSVQGDN